MRVLPQLSGRNRDFQIDEAGEISAWPRQARNESRTDRVGDRHKYDRDFLRLLLYRNTEHHISEHRTRRLGEAGPRPLRAHHFHDHVEGPAQEQGDQKRIEEVFTSDYHRALGGDGLGVLAVSCLACSPATRLLRHGRGPIAKTQGNR